MPETHTCPICGFNGLDEPPYRRMPESDDEPTSGTHGPSWDICSCCGVEFGLNSGDSLRQMRQAWIDEGMPWWSTVEAPPEGWDAAKQLEQFV
jgi:hypothetical protein